MTISPWSLTKGFSKFSKSFKIKLILFISSCSSFFIELLIKKYSLQLFFTTYYYGKVKQNFKDDVPYYMDKIFNNIPDQVNENKFEENLFVKNIIVNKDKGKVPTLSYVATEKWLEQLGNRLEINC